MRALQRVLACVLLPAIVLVAGCGGDSREGTGAASTAPTGTPPQRLELAGIEGWLNSEPLTIERELARGRVVLIDFWTYTCVNCIRTLPFVEGWHERYSPAGLTVIGVHTPEFEFERVRENVAAAIERYGLRYPVAQDNDMATWNAFQNNAWPAKYLIGRDGKVLYQHFGEGQYVEAELAIRGALEAAGHSLEDVEPLGVEPPALEPRGTQTAELYGGYRRNYGSLGGFAGQAEYYEGPDMDQVYTDIGERKPNRWYLEGAWRNEAESISHARRTSDLSEYIALKFVARSVNVVLSPAAGRPPFDMVVEIDGRALAPSEAGPDVTMDEQGRSIVRVTEPRMYELVQLPEFGEHELKLRSDSPDFSIFAFTFGSYVEGA